MKLISYVLLGTFIFASTLTADFKTLTTEEVESEIKKGTAAIDIRRLEEFQQYGIIKGSHKLTFFDKYRRYNVKKWMEEWI